MNRDFLLFPYGTALQERQPTDESAKLRVTRALLPYVL